MPANTIKQQTADHYLPYLDALNRDGVAVIPASVSPDIIRETLGGIKSFFALNKHLFDKHRDEDGHFPRIINLHAAYKKLLDVFVKNPVALAVQDGFFGEISSVYTTLYFERGSAQPIHRDSPYFTTRPAGRYLGVWVALEDANEMNGCLQVIKGGHLVPEEDVEAIALRNYDCLDAISASSESLWNEYQALMTQACFDRGLKVEKIPVKAGDTVIWHPRLPHGGSAIGDLKRTRHSLVLHVTPMNTAVYHQDVFFNPSKIVPEKKDWDYLPYADRMYIDYPVIDFGHKELIPVSALAQA